MRRTCLAALTLILFSFPTLAADQLEPFVIRPLSSGEFYQFIKVFSAMRGPLRKQILQDRKTNFEDADPLQYVTQIRGEKKVRQALEKNNLSWEGFREIMGNLLLGYFSIQPDQTKAAIFRRLASYDLRLADQHIPAEYREPLLAFLQTPDGAALAGFVLELMVIPSENVALAKKNKRQLDHQFYTRFWRKKI